MFLIVECLQGGNQIHTKIKLKDEDKEVLKEMKS